MLNVNMGLLWAKLIQKCSFIYNLEQYRFTPPTNCCFLHSSPSRTPVSSQQLMPRSRKHLRLTMSNCAMNNVVFEPMKADIQGGIDSHCIRQDFPILGQRVHGKPLIYF